MSSWRPHVHHPVAERCDHRLTEFLLKWRHGQVAEAERELELMENMAEKYGTFESSGIETIRSNDSLRERSSTHVVVGTVDL